MHATCIAVLLYTYTYMSYIIAINNNIIINNYHVGNGM